MAIAEAEVKQKPRMFVIAKAAGDSFIVYTGRGDWSDDIRKARVFYDFSAARDLASTLPGSGVVPKDEIDCEER